jgi:hypothetical protein
MQKHVCLMKSSVTMESEKALCEEMLKPADVIESDGETVVNSPGKRAKRNETTEIKAPKIRKIADLRMNADELGEMRSRIAKSVTVIFCCVDETPKECSHMASRLQFVTCYIATKGNKKKIQNKSFSKSLLSGA